MSEEEEKFKGEEDIEREEAYYSEGGGHDQGKDFATYMNEGKKDKPPKKGSYGAAYQGLEDVGEGKRKDKYGRVWESEAKFTKAAQDWNKKKYGTTEPTDTARKKNVSKETLATEHKAASTKVASIAPKSITETKANERMNQTIASANAPESLLKGKAKRQAARAERKSGREHKQKVRSYKQEIRKNKGQVAQIVDKAGNENRTASGGYDTSKGSVMMDVMGSGVAKKAYKKKQRVSDRDYKRESTRQEIERYGSKRESARQERKNLLTDNPVDNRSKRGWDKDY
jgi:hypothetical protein